MRARAVRPSSLARPAVASSTAAAPSVICDDVPAVCTPSSRATGLSVASFSSDVSRQAFVAVDVVRGAGGLAVVVEVGRVDREHLALEPALAATRVAARTCDSSPKWSQSSRVMPHLSAMRSAASNWVTYSYCAKYDFVSGRPGPFCTATPSGMRLIDSTPQPSRRRRRPTATSAAARFVACCDDPHCASTVVAAVSIGRPAASHAVRVMSKVCSPVWVTQPPTTWPTAWGRSRCARWLASSRWRGGRRGARRQATVAATERRAGGFDDDDIGVGEGTHGRMVSPGPSYAGPLRRCGPDGRAGMPRYPGRDGPRSGGARASARSRPRGGGRAACSPGDEPGQRRGAGRRGEAATKELGSRAADLGCDNIVTSRDRASRRPPEHLHAPHRRGRRGNPCWDKITFTFDPGDGDDCRPATRSSTRSGPFVEGDTASTGGLRPSAKRVPLHQLRSRRRRSTDLHGLGSTQTYKGNHAPRSSTRCTSHEDRRVRKDSMDATPEDPLDDKSLDHRDRREATVHRRRVADSTRALRTSSCW